MPTFARHGRRGPKLAAAIVFAAGLAMRQTAAEVAASDSPQDTPSWRIHVTAPAAAWAVPVAPAQAPDPSPTFESRLDREARRRGPFTLAALDPDDDAATRGRSESAEKIFTRALRGLVDDQAESLARGMPGLGDTLRWLDGFGVHASGRGPSRAAAPRPEDLAGPGASSLATAAPERPAPFDASLRMRVDAHPRVELRARAGTLTGVIEVPLLERDVRFGLEQPLGRFGKAAIRGGRSADQGDWADLVVGIRF
jgi:hypothetical protein